MKKLKKEITRPLIGNFKAFYTIKYTKLQARLRRMLSIFKEDMIFDMKSAYCVNGN